MNKQERGKELLCVWLAGSCAGGSRLTSCCAPKVVSSFPKVSSILSASPLHCAGPSQAVETATTNRELLSPNNYDNSNYDTLIQMSDPGLNEHAMTKSRVATLKRELFSAKQGDSHFQDITTSKNHHHPHHHHHQQLPHLIDPTRLITPTPIAQVRKIDKTRDEYHRELSMRKLPTPPGQRQPVRRDIHRETAPNIDQQPQDQLSSDDDGRDQDIEDEPDDDDLDDTADESADNNRTDEPKKPGKLNLRQFDNITTAIGKLTVNPTSASPTSIALTVQTCTSAHVTPSSSSKHNQQPTDPQAPNPRRLNNLRQHRGRAVAPPTLPTNSLFKHSFNRLTGDSSGNETSSQERTLARYNEDDSAIDFSQSPIAQRLLKHSKDYKVSELNSPYQSDSEIQQQSSSGHVARARELFKESTKNEKSKSNRNLSLDSGDLVTSRGETIRQLNEILSRKPPSHFSATRINKGLSNDHLIEEVLHGESSSKKDDKEKKKDKKKLRSTEKLEKRKLKEEERLRRQEEEKQRRQEKKLAGKKSKAIPLNPDSIDDAGIPLFIRCCIEFIESEGLEAEGIYRVPGNRAHVDAFVQKFKEDPEMSILGSDIPVNAVATALKDFLSKKWGPIIPPRLMNELTELSGIPDKMQKMEAIKGLIHRLPIANYNLLRYVFSHFVRVSSNNTLNSMDSKNLAICWWPTLLPLQFSDMVMFEQMRPHLEESIQTMIDQYGYIFEDEEPIVPVS